MGGECRGQMPSVEKGLFMVVTEEGEGRNSGRICGRVSSWTRLRMKGMGFDGIGQNYPWYRAFRPRLCKALVGALDWKGSLGG